MKLLFKCLNLIGIQADMNKFTETGKKIILNSKRNVQNYIRIFLPFHKAKTVVFETNSESSVDRILPSIDTRGKFTFKEVSLPLSK